MAIVFLQQKKFQKVLIFVLVALLIITLVVIWRGLFQKETPTAGEEIILAPGKKVEINFGVFDNPLLEKLQPFSQIEPLGEKVTGVEESEEIGRENPFLSY